MQSGSGSNPPQGRAGGSNTPRPITFCGHAISGEGILHVEDAQDDERFADNPLVTGEPRIRFYAGCPLRVEGFTLGTLCLIDQQPRAFTADDASLLRDLAAVAEQNLAAEWLAMTDELTGLTNRRGFWMLARQVLATCRRLKSPATLIALDLNAFKPINDQFGHAEGDRALRLFADCMKKALRDSDALGRLGGDEFAALLTGTAGADAPAAIARLRETVRKATAGRGFEYEVDFSAGIAELDTCGAGTLEELVERADQAMYREKMDGR
jgi:diguanylate cyclase (GGDEF)-like protein